MGLRRLSAEHLARTALGLVTLAVPLTLAAAWWAANHSTSSVTIHGQVSEDGGWLPGTVRATAGSPLNVRLVSDDVVHGFAVGRSEAAPVELPPGQVVETTLTFDQPGTYTFYCTRWCGPNHWRMRGVIEVSGGQPSAVEIQVPLYLSLGIDIDAPHPASAVPDSPPSAERGEQLGVALPDGFRTRQDFVSRPPAEIWQALRRNSSAAGLSDAEAWNLVAYLWRSTTTDEALQEGQALFAQNCAACHGERGAGDGVMAASILEGMSEAVSSATSAAHDLPSGPADFTDPSTMLGASSALLQGKMLRGGMGTGMPYWGPILTEAQMWALTDYLWTFQFGESP